MRYKVTVKKTSGCTVCFTGCRAVGTYNDRLFITLPDGNMITFFMNTVLDFKIEETR